MLERFIIVLMLALCSMFLNSTRFLGQICVCLLMPLGLIVLVGLLRGAVAVALDEPGAVVAVDEPATAWRSSPMVSRSCAQWGLTGP
jgi:hypothetical protein